MEHEKLQLEINNLLAYKRMLIENMMKDDDITLAKSTSKKMLLTKINKVEEIDKRLEKIYTKENKKEK